MWALYGINQTIEQKTVGGPFDEVHYRRLLALFTDYDYAERYISNSRLKKIRDDGLLRWPFKKRSLLGLYNDYEIEEYTPQESVPVDPTFL